jgi:hypothetical protein
MNESTQPDDIQRQMIVMRSLLHEDAHTLAVDARRLVDWRHHFRAHPWAWCCGAAALGYLLVPKTSKTRGLGRELAPQEPIVAPSMLDMSSSRRLATSPSVAKLAMNMAATVIARGAIAYARRYVEQYVSAWPAQSSHTPTQGATPPAGSPRQP